MKARLLEHTGGNPFFLEESVRALLESGVLQGSRGAYQLCAPLTTVQAPATVQAILASRIDRLAPEDKRLLESASVIGKDVPYDVLLAIADLPEDRLRQGLTNLQAAEFLSPLSLFPQLQYTFKHSLTHEVANSLLLLEQRRRLHREVALWYEHTHAADLTPHLALLAFHW
jgi:predicted ATPase